MKYNKPKQTLCWTCQNAVLGCSWSKHFEPVKGWKAKPTKIKLATTKKSPYTDSYIVIKCPEYIPDKPRKTPKEKKKDAQVKEIQKDIDVSGKYGREAVMELRSLLLKAKAMGITYKKIEKMSHISISTIDRLHRCECKTVRIKVYRSLKEVLGKMPRKEQRGNEN